MQFRMNNWAGPGAAYTGDWGGYGLVCADRHGVSSDAGPFPHARIFVLIPAYQPDDALINLVDGLLPYFAHGIVVVDDGSTQRTSLFQKLQSMGVEVLTHGTNRGKGAALKTGLDWIAREYPDTAGIVTADADGQHLVDDVLRIAASLRENLDTLVLGVREFGAETPWRSDLGNRVTIFVLRALTGVSLRDTQTGLRGVPIAFVPQLLQIRRQGYAFEMEMLLTAIHSRRRLLQVPIATVYLRDNRSSHFNPLLDSLRIYFVLLRFSFSSLLATLVDYLAFVALLATTDSIAVSQYVSRTLSGGMNFLVNRVAVFQSQQPFWVSALGYFVLAYTLGTLSLFGMQYLISLGMSAYTAKLVAESSLFVISFLVQRFFIFARR